MNNTLATPLVAIARGIAVGLSAVCLSASVQSQTPPKASAKLPVRMSFNGVGTHSCGVYLENMRGLQAEMWKQLYQQWGAGFMAGASNEGRGGNPYTDLETYTAWLDKWCTDDPSSKVVVGIVALGKRLSSQQ
jgi:hypothetical protein